MTKVILSKREAKLLVEAIKLYSFLDVAYTVYLVTIDH